MGEIVTEKELEFDFRSALKVVKFDDEHIHGMSHCMKAVDFLVEWEDEFWFVEVKDPDCAMASDKERRKFRKKIENKALFSKVLGPKLKDSFLYLYLGKKIPSKTLKYFVLLALDSLQPENLLPLSDNLQNSCCLRKAPEAPWANPYIDAAMVFTEKTWNEHLGHCPVTRIV